MNEKVQTTAKFLEAMSKEVNKHAGWEPHLMRLQQQLTEAERGHQTVQVQLQQIFEGLKKPKVLKIGYVSFTWGW